MMLLSFQVWLRCHVQIVQYTSLHGFRKLKETKREKMGSPCISGIWLLFKSYSLSVKQFKSSDVDNFYKGAIKFVRF